MSEQDNTLQTLQKRHKVEWIRGLSRLQWQDKGAWPLIFLKLDWGLLSFSTDREVAFQNVLLVKTTSITWVQRENIDWLNCFHYFKVMVLTLWSKNS